MTPAPYTEDNLVQQATADYLEQQLGWDSVFAYNNEDFGPDSLLGRESDREVVLTRILREKLVELNPELPDAAYDNAVRQVTATVASQTLATTNSEKDQVTIEQTFEALLKLVNALDEEEDRAIREGLDEESLAIFDLLQKPDLSQKEVKKIKSVAAALLSTLKSEKLRIDQWRDKEATRDAVRITIHDFLYSDETGLPVDSYSEKDVDKRSNDVFHHVFRAYPVLPSPFYTAQL